MKYRYSFVPHVFDTKFPTAFYEMLNALVCRIEDDMTEKQFLKYREDLKTMGIDLREITRVPCWIPEKVE